MTATNSQSSSVKLLSRFWKSSSKNNLSLQISIALDGELAKRIFDILFSLIVLIFFSPLYLLLATLVLISSPGPIFYIQTRVGKDFKQFRCIKFRTMVQDADNLLEVVMARSPQKRQEFSADYKLKQDPRITRVGNILRLTSLDEFPQFWNVLKGEMSIVGPRPLVPEELPRYGRRIKTVLKTKPGITGLWQVSGRNDIPYPKRVQMDAYYAISRGWLLDLWIILKTVGVVFYPKGNGAY